LEELSGRNLPDHIFTDFSVLICCLESIEGVRPNEPSYNRDLLLSAIGRIDSPVFRKTPAPKSEQIEPQ
jgi:hypothetical protein